MKKTALFLPVLLSIISGLISCLPQKKINADKKQLQQVDSQLVKHSNNLKHLDELRERKEDQNEMDSVASNRIKNFIDKTKNEIDTLLNQNAIHINGAVVNKDDWDRLRQALSQTRSAEQRIQQKILLLEDLMNRNMVIKLEQDILFEPGSYRVTPSVVKQITKVFEPAVAEIDRFTKKYPDFPLSLVITFKGYADATVINEGSSLYRELKERLSLSGKEPDSKELNKELSRARAEAVRNLFSQFAATKAENGIYVRNVLYLYEGKGEAFPDPKVTDYKVSDPRRRVVLLFWSILPD